MTKQIDIRSTAWERTVEKKPLQQTRWQQNYNRPFCNLSVRYTKTDGRSAATLFGVNLKSI